MCVKHQRYEGINRPAVACEECWELFLYKHPVNAATIITRMHKQLLDLKAESKFLTRSSYAGCTCSGLH